MTNTVERLRILDQNEIAEIYELPQLTHEERIAYLTLSPSEQKSLEELRTVKSKAYFILQLGYFRTRRMFFSFDFNEVQDDLNYIQMRYFDHGNTIDDLETLNKRTKLKHQKMILQLCRFQDFSVSDKKILEEKARQAVRVSSKPTYVFRILMEHLSEKRVVLPGYRYMQDTVSRALAYERKRLAGVLAQRLTPEDITDLLSLLEDTWQLHKITQLRREPKDYSYGQIKEELRRREQIEPLYHIWLQDIALPVKSDL